MAGLVVKPRARIFHGHDWVYQSEVLKAFGNPADGDVISLKDGKDRLLGSAIYNSQSQIVARRFSRQRQELDEGFFRRRLLQAVEYRQRRGVDPVRCRVLWSESDGVPGLIVDRYGDAAVMQTLTLAMDSRRAMIAGIVADVLGVSVVVERNEAPIRQAEGMELRGGILSGQPDADGGVHRTLSVAGVEFEADLLHGQKTGFYLDQVENYAGVARFARGRTVLDCFSNQGAFGLCCARAGATEVTAVDISEEAVAGVARNAARNGLSVRGIAANAFDLLKAEEHRGATYDLVILDPPSFTKQKSRLTEAMRGYKEIHLRALKLLAPNGLLATFSCSHHVSSEMFHEMIVEALVDARKTVRQIGTFQQAADHPILPTIPETGYLKGFLLELAPGR